MGLNMGVMKRMQSSTPFQSRSFFWQAILILLPVGVLTAVGLYSLRQDRLLAEQEAKELGAAIAQRIAQAVGGRELTQQLGDYRNANFSLHFNRTGDPGLLRGEWSGGSKTKADAVVEQIKAWQQANPGVDLPAMPVSDCVLNIRGELSTPQLYPLSPSPPDWLLELSPEQRRLWLQEEKAEFVSNDPEAARVAIKNFLTTKPPDAARANAVNSIYWFSKLAAYAARVKQRRSWRIPAGPNRTNSPRPDCRLDN